MPARERMKPQDSKWLVAPRPVLEEQPLQPDHALREPVQLRVERDRLRGLQLEIDLEMVLQVLAHAGQGVHHVDAGSLQTSPGPMPESCSSFGELMAEAAMITSRRAWACFSSPATLDTPRRWRGCPRAGSRCARA